MVAHNFYNKQDPKTIQAMFGSIAKYYDKANTILSLGLHHYWNNKLVNIVFKKPQENPTILDLCSGTGAIAFHYLKKIHHVQKSVQNVYLLDFCDEMLHFAQAKARQMQFDHYPLAYLNADAQTIPLPASCVDHVAVAYGIRNIKDPCKAFAEVLRVLKPGGTLNILELTRPINPFLRFGHTLYLKGFLPLAGRLMTANGDAYRYLSTSINSFIPPADIQQMLIHAGFKNLWVKPLTAGLATLVGGEKENDKLARDI